MNGASKTRKPRRGCLYNATERTILEPFKHEYRLQTNSERRGHIFKSKILPAIFSYWAHDGPGSMAEAEVEIRVKVCFSIRDKVSLSITHF
jgi:hypothetical protein